jgi:predicted amidohydrolase
MKIKISLAQFAFKMGKIEENIAIAREVIREAANKGSDIVLLPELWASGYDLKNWQRYASPINQGIFLLVRKMAQENKIAVGGTLLELWNGKAFNTFVFYGSEGETWGVYRKIHRFRLLEEEKWLGAGDRLVLAETPWGDIGLGICYDLRFPEMFRPYAVSGAQLLLIAAEWPDRRITHWSKLLQARAIENQLFVAGVNKVGLSMGVELGGRSAIIDPWGSPIVEGEKGEILLTAEINLDEVEKAREVIPVFRDRRPDVYKDFEGPPKNNFKDDKCG